MQVIVFPCPDALHLRSIGVDSAVKYVISGCDHIRVKFDGLMLIDVSDAGIKFSCEFTTEPSEASEYNIWYQPHGCQIETPSLQYS
jgi:hypothetical protein